MSEKQTENTWLRDGLGLVLFAVFSFLGVLVIMAWAQPPLDPDQSRSGLVLGLVDFLGELPLLIACLGLVWLGFRLFLGEVPDKLGPLGISLGALVLGLSIVLGATWQGHGGSMGRAAAGMLSPVVAALFGLVVIGFPLWRLWVGPVFSVDSATEEAPKRVLDTDTRDGLSVAEAEALLPEEIKEPVPVPSPYPPDVRREGRIPEGARPIIPDDGRTTTQDPLDGFPVPGAPQGEPEAEQRPDSHLAGAGSPDEGEGAGLRTPEPIRGQAAGEPGLESPPAPAAAPSKAEAPPAGAAVVPEIGGIPVVPSPSWEQPELFQEEQVTEEPVDAYGTPVSLVETLREEVDPAAEFSGAEVKPKPLAEVLEVSAEVAAEPEAEEAEGEEEEYAEEAEYEEEDAEEEDEEYEEEDDEDSEYAEEGGDEEDEEEDEDDEEEEEEYAEGEEVDEEEQDEDEEAEAAEETQPGPQAVSEPAVEIVPHKAQKARAKSGSKSKPAPAASESEAEDDLVFKAGTLILERERVAVSLLQREFHLDFDQATHVLDRLQESGLIGPYVGGQRRDILLTAEEWQEKRVGSS